MMVRVGRPRRSVAIICLAMGLGGAGWPAVAAAQVASPATPPPSTTHMGQTIPGSDLPDDPTMLDPSAPLAPLPEIGVAWPDLATAPGDAMATIVATVDAA
ncbi:MAG: outer membrane protein assembly factor, partial [Sphingomonas parapaucimobilis]